MMDDSCENTHLVNELDIPILAMGLKNVVIAASPSGILVSDKLYTSEINRYTGKLSQEIRYAEKSWGEFRVLIRTEMKYGQLRKGAAWSFLMTLNVK